MCDCRLPVILLFGFLCTSPSLYAQSDSSHTPLSLHANYDGMRLSSGLRTEEEVIRTLKAQEKYILACLQTAYSGLDKSASRGVLQLRIFIQPNGYASDVQILRAPTTLQAVQECLEQIFRRARFKNVRDSNDQQLIIDYMIE
jgi:hypothetical protein